MRHLGADIRVAGDGARAERVRRDEQAHLLARAIASGCCATITFSGLMPVANVLSFVSPSGVSQGAASRAPTRKWIGSFVPSVVAKIRRLASLNDCREHGPCEKIGTRDRETLRFELAQDEPLDALVEIGTLESR